MNRPRLGWYVHHHGSGHLTRALAIAQHLDADVRCFSSLPKPRELPDGWSWIALPRDDDAPRNSSGEEYEVAAADPTAGGLLHWAPLGHPGHAERLAAIAHSIGSDPVDAFVVDVSAEVTLLVRLLGARPVVMAQPGVRTDEPHRLAYAAASTIVAPWPQQLLSPAHLDAVADRVVYTGGISRFEGRSVPVVGSADFSSRESAAQGATSHSRHSPPDDWRGQHGAAADADAPPAADVLVLGSRGGTAVTDDDIDRAQRATGRRWQSLGGRSWTDDPWERLRSARVVVSWAGQNAVADLASAGAHAVVVPQDRPFDEQAETARALDRAGLAIVAREWPTAEDWPDVLARAEALRPDWSRWCVTGAAGRAADAIIATARGERDPRAVR